MKVRALRAALILVATMWLGGCGHYVCDHTFGNASCSSSGSGFSSGNGNGGQTAFVYEIDTHTQQSLTLEGLNVANSETFETVSNFVSPSLPQYPDGGLVVVNKQYLYIDYQDYSQTDPSAIYGFSIDGSTGALTALASNPTSVTQGSQIIADPNGKYLFVSDTVGSGVTMLTVNSDGTLTAGTETLTAVDPFYMATDGSGKFLYVMNGGSLQVYSYVGGVLVAEGSPVSFNMFQMVGDVGGNYMYATNGTTSGIYVYTIASGTGALTAVSSESPFVTAYPPNQLVISPSGGNLYSFNGVALEAFSLSSGTLKAVSGEPYTALPATSGQMDQSGQYLFAIAPQVGSSVGVFVYNVGTGGAISNTLPTVGYIGYGWVGTDAP